MANLSLLHQKSSRNLKMRVKRYGEARAQAKPKAAPRGGVSSSMIILESDYGIVLNTAEARDNDEYYAMVKFWNKCHHLAFASQNGR